MERRVLEEIRRTHTLSPVNCRLSCPQLSRCVQAGSHLRLYGKDRAEVFFIFDAPSTGDIENGLPLVGKVGQIFRDQILRPFTQSTASVGYHLSYLIKSALPEDGKRFSKREYDTCWHHLMSDLGRHRPRLIVAFGASVFQFLHGKAVNKREIDLLLDGNTSMSHLRRHLFKFKFLDGYEADVIVCYGPGFVLTTPTATRYLEDDRRRIIDATKGRFAVHSTDRSRSLVKIEKIEVLRTLEAALNFFDRLASGELLQEPRPVAFDTETLNLNRRFNNSFLTWQFSYEPGCAVVVPIEHPDCPLFESIDAKMQLVEAAQRLFNAPSSRSNISMFVAHNAKFDLAVLYGLLGVIQREVDAPFFWCTQNAAHWLDENRKGLARFMEAGDKPYSLKTLGKEFFNFRYRAEHLELRSDGNLVELSIDDLAEYGGSDTILTLALQAHQLVLADEQPNGARDKLVHFMRHYYSKTNRSLALMECNGLYVSKTHLGHLQGPDSPIWNRISEIKHGLLQNSPEVLEFRKKYSQRLSTKDAVAYEGLWGDEPEADVIIELDIKKKTHRDAFYLDFLKVEPLEYSQKTKEPSFDAAFLEHYSKPENYKQVPGVRPYLAYYNTAKEDPKTGEPIYPPNPIQLIGELAKLEKLAAGYLNSMQKLLDDKAGDCRDSRVRASFHPTGTDTGRLSSCIAKGMRVDIVRNLGENPCGIPIEDVKVGDLVYCYDNQTPPKLSLRPVLAAWQTGVRKVIRLHWTGRGKNKTGYLDLTPEHRVRLRDGSYKEAQHLTPSDSILALSRTYAGGYSKLQATNSGGIAHLEHRFIYEKYHKVGLTKKEIHHKDGDKRNHVLENLECVARCAFFSEPNERAFSTKFQVLRILAQSKGEAYKAAQGLGGAPIHLKLCEKYKIDFDLALARYNSDGQYVPRHRLVKALENGDDLFWTLGVAKDGAFLLLKSYDLHLKTKMQFYRLAIRNKGQMKDILYDPYCPGRDRWDVDRAFTAMGIDLCYVAARFDRDGKYISRGRVLEASKRFTSIFDKAVYLNKRISDYNFLEFSYGFHDSFNHKISKIEALEEPVPVYDLHVDEFNNFIVEELCVKNSSPNFQNLPAGRSKAAKEIKNMFQAEPPSKRWKEGTCLIQVDYAAAEVFWAVNFSQEPELVTFLNKCADDLNLAYQNSDSLSDEEFEKIILSTDFHKRTASLMFEIGPEQVSKQMRQESKAITFGLLYGKTVQGLANDNNWTIEEAEAKMRKFFSAFPRLERWLKEQVETARNHGYVETLMGRRRRLSHFYATKQPKHAGEADRKAMNSPIQGQSSDAGIIGLNNFVEYVLAHELERRWLIENVVHDSILFQVPMQDVPKVLPVIKRCLTVGMREYIERHWNCVVPVTLRCDFEIGLRYGDLHGWDQRAKTLEPILDLVRDDAKKLWHVKENAIGLRKPPIALDLVIWQGDEAL